MAKVQLKDRRPLLNLAPDHSCGARRFERHLSAYAGKITVKVRVQWTLLALTAMPLVSAAADEPKLSCLKDFTYSQDFLHRHPKAGAVCREVVMKDGQKWARFDARVVGLKGNQVTVNFIDGADQPVEMLTFTAPPDARVLVNGQEMTYGALGKGDPLSFWVPESRAGFYAAPGAAKLTEIKVARVEQERR